MPQKEIQCEGREFRLAMAVAMSEPDLDPDSNKL